MREVSLTQIVSDALRDLRWQDAMRALDEKQQRNYILHFSQFILRCYQPSLSSAVTSKIYFGAVRVHELKFLFFSQVKKIMIHFFFSVVSAHELVHAIAKAFYLTSLET